MITNLCVVRYHPKGVCVSNTNHIYLKYYITIFKKCQAPMKGSDTLFNALILENETGQQIDLCVIKYGNSRTVNQTNNSPKSLSRLEIYRLTRNALNT